MLLPYLQENAADYAHERGNFWDEKIIEKHQQKKNEGEKPWIYSCNILQSWCVLYGEGIV